MILLIILGLVFLVLILLGIWYWFFRSSHASNKWATAVYSKDGSNYKATVSFAKDLSEVSAIHIHEQAKGTVGPIISWLGTTSEWNNQAQHSKASVNSPCCKDTACNIVSPKGTMDISALAGNTLQFNIPDPSITSTVCDAMGKLKDSNAYLVVHGKNFTDGNKWLDILEATKFTK
jgi:cytoskeletal protein RodZ